MKKYKSYLIDLIIVTLGVLIALFVSNLKENSQARKYHIASMETIKNEVEKNYTDLTGVIDQQKDLLDTIIKYKEGQLTILELIRKSNGLTVATLNNAGIEFYTKNQIQSIDFEMMSTLLQMNYLTDLINSKLDKLIDFVYPSFFLETTDSKMLLNMYLRNLLESEIQLEHVYKHFLEENFQK